jgi:hypothetical protein
MSNDDLYTKVLVRRVGIGAAPFTWEVVGANAVTPLHVSSDRFRSMEAAYSSGQARLGEFLQRPRANRGKRGKAAVRQASIPATDDFQADEADESGMDGDLIGPSPDAEVFNRIGEDISDPMPEWNRLWKTRL